MLAQLDADPGGPAYLRDEAARLSALVSPSTQLAEEQQGSTRTAAMIMADAAAALVAQANYSRQDVSELLTFAPGSAAQAAD